MRKAIKYAVLAASVVATAAALARAVSKFMQETTADEPE